MSILETITHRESSRTYDGRPLVKQDIQKLQTFIKEGIEFRGAPIAFKMLSTSDNQSESIKNLSAYGMIKGAKNYIAGIAKKDTSLVDFGYAMEQIVLYADSIGLGTCWLGGTFKKKAVARLLRIKNDEWIPAMMPVGYAAARPSARARLTRLTIKADSRKPFESLFFNGKNGLPLTISTSGGLAEVLEAVRMAPSASNKQPWRLVLNSLGQMEFYLCKTPGYSDKLGYDIQMADMGIAMWHFMAAARELGIKGAFKASAPDRKSLSVDDEWVYVTTFVKG